MSPQEFVCLVTATSQSSIFLLAEVYWLASVGRPAFQQDRLTQIYNLRERFCGKGHKEDDGKEDHTGTQDV